MAGSSRGIMTCMMAGLRVASRPTYIPGYMKNGKAVSQQLKITAFLNNGKNDKRTVFELQVWGKYADSVAHSLTVGKEFHATCRIDSYKARVWNKNGELMINPDGSPVMVTKHSYVVKALSYGDESEKYIADEIAANKRPANWNDKGAGEEAWKAALARRAAYNKLRPGVDAKGNTITLFGEAQVKNAGETYTAPANNLQTQVANTVDNSAVQSAFGGAQQAAELPCPW